VIIWLINYLNFSCKNHPMRLLLLLCLPIWLTAQSQVSISAINPKYLNGYWPAQWITHPTASRKEFSVQHYRKVVELAEKPNRCIVHISGDNRYKFYVNGKMVCLGPARSDLMHWNFESVDLAPFLQTGKNVLAAVVWNFGQHRPVFQQSWETGFIFQADEEKFKDWKSDKNWKVLENKAYSPQMEGIWNMRTYLVTGPGEGLDAQKYPWGWENVDFDDSNWPTAQQIWPGVPKTSNTEIKWGLEPRQIPMMEATPQRFAGVRRAEGATVTADFLAGKSPLNIPANSKVSFLLDQGKMTTAYPILTLSGGKGAKITLTYTEALMEKEGYFIKKNRNEVEGKIIKGYQDMIWSDGGKQRKVESLWFRTWRYVEVQIETGAEALSIDDLQSVFSAYPFEQKAQFSASDPRLQAIWETGWHTARLCAGETYYDCPYYEQLQYVGDTRIQALISLYNTGDERLMRKAITDFGNSLFFEGLTQSRYPAATPQVIPTYSLFWVNMLRDYDLHCNDDAFVRQWLPGVRSVIDWFLSKRNPKTWLIENPGYWNFVDWCFPNGVPDLEGGSSTLTLQLIYTMQDAVELYRTHTVHEPNVQAEFQAAINRYNVLISTLKSAVKRECYSAERGLFADTPAKKKYSQHPNILAVLTNTTALANQAPLLRKISTDTGIVEATFYFKFYLFQAYQKTGLGDLYLPQLKPWHDMLALGQTTFAEEPDPTRSDCHAWSASPNYDLLATVCGIRPAARGFRKVRIQPALGDLTQVNAKMPHPQGEIVVDFTRQGDVLKAKITLPATLSGSLVWKGKTLALKGGFQELSL
jgi:alpha-L-rhamnosidase